MKLTKEQMMENIARKFGLENKWVIAFCSACECGLYSDELMEMIYNWKMAIMRARMNNPPL